MVLDLLVIGLVITLYPLPIAAFVVVVSAPAGCGRGWRSSSPGSRAWWP